MSVILGSEIARLVFGYLQEEQLEAAATEFCKTSPYLVEEYDWLQRGYKAYKISDLCLVDIIREHCEIKYAVTEYIEALPLSSLGETLKIQKSLSGKVNAIIDLITNTSKPNSRKRPYSTISSTDTTQSNDLPGYEPPLKERRLSRKLILHRDSTPKPNFVLTPTTLKQNVEDVNNDQVDKNASPDQVNTAEKSRHETSHYPIFTETILENTQFQNVLVDNINRILETSSDRMDVSAQHTHDAIYNNNSLQEQVKHAIDNIILSTEQDPTFQQVLDDVLQHTALQEQSIRTTSINDNASKSIETIDSPVPLKQRLRNRSHDKPRPNYNEIDQSSKKKQRKGKVEVISNEIVSGEIRDLLQPIPTVRENYVPLNQVLYLNSDRSTTTFGQDLVYVNVGAPTFPQFRIDADTPMFLQDISLANDHLASTSLTPGSIINLPTIEQQIQPIQSMLPNVIIRDIVEVSKPKHYERLIKTTPTVSKNMPQAKAQTFSTPRRHSHVRSLNFTSSEDSVNDRLTNRNGNDKKSETESNGSTSKPNEKSSLEEVEEQQDSSDAADFSKEFDEATVISVDLSPTEANKSECSKEEKSDDAGVEKKKPQTRQQSQKDLEMWNQMRHMKKSEFDNYLRQTVASKTGSASSDKKKVKKRKSKTSVKSDELNISLESSKILEIEGKQLKKALESVKKSDPSPVVQERSTSQCTKEISVTEQLKPSASPIPSAERNDGKNSRSSNNCSSAVRKRLIQIKLPASTKKKQNTSQRYRTKVPGKQKQDVVETIRIDPSETIDIDLISPIDHPKELNNAVKGGVNLNSLLETPCKDISPFKFPITPGFAASSCTKTPGVRLMKDYDSLIKFPEYPTPSFAITPGRTKTPLSQPSSQKDGSSYNRATDYSSGSSYYKPDESDDIDKNIDVLIKENRAQIMTGGLGVDPHQNIIFSDDQVASENEESDSSSSTSSETSSTSSSCSSSLSMTTSAVDSKNDAPSSTEANKMFLSQKNQNQLKLEQVRLRTMATLRSDKKTERFRKPKTKTAIQRKNVTDMMAMMRKPLQMSKMAGNSTPKIAPKVLPKNLNRPNPKTIGATPSKRKIATPRRVIYLDYKEAAKTSVRVSHDRRQAEQLLSQLNNNETLNDLQPVQEPPFVSSATPAETIDAIENHIAKTCHTSFDEYNPKLTNENQFDTPLLQQLQDKSEVTVNTSTPEMVLQASSMSRATLVRELFGDGTMSDSDFMDTPNKTKNVSAIQTSIVPVSKTKSETSTDSIIVESTVKKAVTSKVKESTNLIADIPNVSDSFPKNLICKNIDIIKSKCNLRNATVTKPEEANEVVVVKDSSTSGLNSMEPIAETSNVDDASLTNSSVGKSIIKDPSSDIRGSLSSRAVDLKAFVTVANSSTTRECDKVPTRTTSNDSLSESDDDNDDYDDCALISSLPISNSSNRIYHSVISDTKECAMKLTTQSLDMRPVATYFNGRKIVMRTCDGVILYSSAPKTHSPPTISSGMKILTNKRKNVKVVHGDKKKLDVESKVKVAHDETGSSAPEKNARFNIVAKHKGPVNTTSSRTLSSCDQRKLLPAAKEKRKRGGAFNEVTTSPTTKIPPLLKDMDINKVLGKIHPSKEIA